MNFNEYGKLHITPRGYWIRVTAYGHRFSRKYKKRLKADGWHLAAKRIFKRDEPPGYKMPPPPPAGLTGLMAWIPRVP